MTLHRRPWWRMTGAAGVCAVLVSLSGVPALAGSDGYRPGVGHWTRFGTGSYRQAYSCWGPQRYAPPQGWLPTITDAESEAVAARNANSQPDQFGHYAQPYDGAIPTPCLYMNPNNPNQVFNATTGQVVSGAGVAVPGSLSTGNR